MGLYNGSVCKLCRREGEKLFLKSDKCDSPKCPVGKRKYPPGFHGPNFRGKMSEFGIRLREKQKAKRFYYVSEGQFRKYYERASRMHGDTGEELLQLVERRFDNVVFRMGLSRTRKQARQLVNHGHFLLNGKKANIPSMLLKEGDVITVQKNSEKSFAAIVEIAKKTPVNVWLEADYDKHKYVFVRLPERGELDVPVNEQMVIEYYSR